MLKPNRKMLKLSDFTEIIYCILLILGFLSCQNENGKIDYVLSSDDAFQSIEIEKNDLSAMVFNVENLNQIDYGHFFYDSGFYEFCINTGNKHLKLDSNSLICLDTINEKFTGYKKNKKYSVILGRKSNESEEDIDMHGDFAFSFILK